MPRIVEFQIVPCHIENPPGIGTTFTTVRWLVPPGMPLGEKKENASEVEQENERGNGDVYTHT
jgi:hypothetical protein